MMRGQLFAAGQHDPQPGEGAGVLPGCFRLERSPGGPCTHWKTPPCHGALGNATFPICSECDARVSKTVIYGLKPRHPTGRLFQRCRWQAEGQRNILFHEGLPLPGAEDHRMDVVAWLRGLGLEQYAPAFRDNDVDGEVLPELTSDDLISIGVTSVGHRRKLLAAIFSLGAAPPTATVMAAPRDAPAPTDAERRQLTVMFCDLVGSTALSARLDPEDLREVIAAYHRAVAEIVTGFDGFVSRYMGDGVLVYFGHPQAHEDDAERAVRAGRSPG
jgi:hypothetical protein